MRTHLTVNLSYLEKSDIGYEKIVYKDSQIDIKLKLTEVRNNSHDWRESNNILIVSRMNSYQDLFFILSALDALKRPPYSVDLYVPCFIRMGNLSNASRTTKS